MREHFDPATLVIIIITLVLFAVALFTKGITHDLLLEAGVFLVSLKLIMMSYKNSVTSKQLLKDLHDIKKALKVEEQD